MVDIIIPARARSTRFPNKPLAQLCGRSVLERVWRLARAVPQKTRIVISSDDDAILSHATSFGADVQPMRTACHNGTERVARTLVKLGRTADWVVNLQGDAILIPPWVIAATVAAAQAGGEGIYTPVVPLEAAAFARYRLRKASGRASGTLAVAAPNGRALYFSKGLIPLWREPPSSGPLAWRHVGVYVMRPSAAADYLALKPTPLEQAECLEQLRWLEHGRAVYVVPVDLRGRSLWSVDYPEDIEVAAEIINREGELC